MRLFSGKVLKREDMLGFCASGSYGDKANGFSTASAWRSGYWFLFLLLSHVDTHGHLHSIILYEYR